MSLDNKLQRILCDHIEQMSKDLEKISNGDDNFVFKIYERYLLINICEKVSEIFKKEPIVLKLKGDCIVVGDLHGHIIDLYRIFTIFDLPPKTTYLFLGDIVDRGGFSIETITLLFVLKLLYPSNIYIIRGNHEFNMGSEKETQNLNQKYVNSFRDQINSVYASGNSKVSQSYSQKSMERAVNKPTNDSTHPNLPNVPTITNHSRNYAFSVHIKLKSHSITCNSSNVSRNPSTNDQFSISANNSLYNNNDCLTDNNLNSTADSLKNQRKENKLDFHNSLYQLKYTSSNSYSERLYMAFCSAFSYIPLAAMFGKNIICIHGGIGGSFTNLEHDIASLERPITNYENNIIENILWSDPMPPEKEDEFKNINFMTSSRGRGCIFGKTPLDTFMKTNHLSLMIRAHEVVENGIRLQFNNRLITVFSASSYINQYGNNSGVLKVSEDNKVTTYSFPPFNFLNRDSAEFVFNNGTHAPRSLNNVNHKSNSTSITPCNSRSYPETDLNEIEVNDFYNTIPNSCTNINDNNNNLSKIVSKTLLSNNRKFNQTSDKIQLSSTRRRIKFGPKNAKKCLSEAAPIPTFS